MKYVIHTHSVYANIVCCCSEGRSLADEILKEEKYGHIWIPYVNPGFSLVLAMNKEIAEYKKTYGHSPQVVFMENHGLVVTADTADSCLELHERVNEKIKITWK